MKTFVYRGCFLEIRIDVEEQPVVLEKLIEELDRLKKLLPVFRNFETSLWPPRDGYNGIYVTHEAFHAEYDQEKAEIDIQRLSGNGFQEME